MLREFSKKFVNYIAENNYTEEEIEQMEYTFRLLMFEIIKIIGEILLFSAIGCFKEILIILIVTVITKPHIGGYHEDTQVKCFICSIIISMGIIILAKQCNLSFLSNIVILIFSIFAVYNQAPIINPDMPLTRTDLINKNRRKGLIESAFFSLLSIGMYYYSEFYAVITWTIVTNSIFMFNKRKILK